MNDYEVKHLAALRPGLAECTLFLRRSGAFPLAAPCALALYGNGARHTVKGGTGSGEVNSRMFITAEEGLKAAGFRLTTNLWLNAYDGILAEAKKNYSVAGKKGLFRDTVGSVMDMMGKIMPEPEYNLSLYGGGDAAVYVLARNSGEGTDRQVIKGDYLLTDTERRDILALAEKFDKFLLVLNVGGPVDLSGLESVKDILLLSQLGVETGAVLADILLGKAFPSGKLATGWTSAGEYCPVGEFAQDEETHYYEGVYVGYRYFDTVGARAMFPFGSGLGYTDFSVKSAAADVKGDTVTVKASVKNIGSFPGKETVQLYVSCPDGKLDKPYQTLAAFAKTPLLQPEEEAELSLSFRLPEIASYDTETACYILEKGDYVLRLGNSSVNTEEAAVLRLDKTAVTAKVQNLFGDCGFEDWRPEKVKMPKSKAPVIKVKAADIPTYCAEYDISLPVSPEAEALTDEDLAMLNVGLHEDLPGLLAVIGNAAFSVAGAAGESFNGLVMADGPAGLRLSRYYTEKNGKVKSLGFTIPESVGDMMPGFISNSVKAFSEYQIKHSKNLREQYTTAIPIGTALAQSWNTDFAALCGDIVGEEMDLFKVDLWLAPALNIHRNVLCGRNFEYFSEDPLISGRMAAAITKGVQKHKGRYTTVKHFAANDQETKRYSSDSRVSERALREIYLRGFEIVVKEAAPGALMSSYNLINGVRASESRALITKLLREEWGFRGIVMTDWLSAQDVVCRESRHEVPRGWRVAASGHNLLMPGTTAYYEEMLSGLKEGKLTRRQLEENAAILLGYGKKD